MFLPRRIGDDGFCTLLGFVSGEENVDFSFGVTAKDLVDLGMPGDTGKSSTGGNDMGFFATEGGCREDVEISGVVAGEYVAGVWRENEVCFGL